MNVFDERARDWDSDPEKVERAQAAADSMRRVIPLRRSMKALEYGCGTGLLSFALRDDLRQITLADSSPGMLQVRYDLVYSLLVLHHIDDTRFILGRFHALLEPAGILCICDLDQEDGSFHKHEFDGHLGFNRDELKKTVRNAGFEAVQFSTACTIRRGGKAYPLFLMKARKPGGV
jgi:ubiquinone/menaquinone biosynthesis C-methylase UbiE